MKFKVTFPSYAIIGNANNLEEAEEKAIKLYGHEAEVDFLCEACDESIAGSILKLNSTEKPYRVCLNCLSPLVNEDLSRKQFKNLLENGHDVNEFLLHGDFYDKLGVAQQPYRGSR